MKRRIINVFVVMMVLVSVALAGRYISIVAGEMNTEEETTTQKVVKIEAPTLSKKKVKSSPCITWKKNPNAGGYEVYMAQDEDGEYKLVKKTKNNYIKIKNFGWGEMCHVKVLTYKKVDGTIHKSKMSKPIQILSHTKLLNARSTTAGSVTVRWAEGVDNSVYYVQYSKDKSFKNDVKKIKVKNRTQTSVTVSNLEEGSTYYFRIRTYMKVGNKKFYSMYVNPKKVKVLSRNDIISGGMKDTDGFFKDSVFIGDSVLQGLQIYVNNHEAGYLDGANVMGVISYSLIAAVQDKSDYHPVYKGKRMAPAKLVKKMKAKKVFLSLGVNDIHNTKDANRAYNNYVTLISKIKKENPSVQVYVISTTYAAKGNSNAPKYTAAVKEMNSLVKSYCDKNGHGFIDVASYLASGSGYLKKDLCSDGYVHQTYAAYGIWDKVLRNFAWNQNKLNK